MYCVQEFVTVMLDAVYTSHMLIDGCGVLWLLVAGFCLAHCDMSSFCAAVVEQEVHLPLSLWHWLQHQLWKKQHHVWMCAAIHPVAVMHLIA